MIDGHGDDSYKYSRPITANFSSNVYSKVNLSRLKAHLCECIGEISNYPEPEPYTLEARIASRCQLPSGAVCVTNGATEAIYLIAQTFRGTNTAILQPTFSEYADACRMHGHRVSSLYQLPKEQDGYRLPDDVRIQASEEVPLTFHPRKVNCVKTYEYKILNRKIDMPLQRLYSHFCYFNLDLEKMQKAASYLIGEHDFKSFCTVRTQAEETVRTIYSLTVTKADDLITIRISGSGFLYNMVRIIAGTLVKIGMGVYPPEKMEEILEEKNRAAAGPTIPARGLTLVSLEYEKELAPYLEGENKHWHYVLDQRNVPEKGLAYLTIERCEPEELDGVLRRVIHQAYRNGAKQVFVRDTFGEEGSIYGYYRLRRQPEVEEGWLEAIYEGEHQ